MKLKALALSAAAVAALSATPAQALTLVVDGGWEDFSFGDTGSALSDDYDFVLTDTAYLKITDAFLYGDVFQLTINGVVQGLTSTPGTGPTTDDPDTAFDGGLYSRAFYELGAGSYDVTGIVADSPFGGGGGFIELSSTAPVPEPATWAFMIFGFGAIGGALRSNGRRQRKANVNVSYA